VYASGIAISFRLASSDQQAQDLNNFLSTHAASNMCSSSIGKLFQRNAEAQQQSRPGSSRLSGVMNKGASEGGEVPSMLAGVTFGVRGTSATPSDVRIALSPAAAFLQNAYTSDRAVCLCMYLFKGMRLAGEYGLTLAGLPVLSSSKRAYFIGGQGEALAKPRHHIPILKACKVSFAAPAMAHCLLSKNGRHASKMRKGLDQSLVYEQTLQHRNPFIKRQ